MTFEVVRPAGRDIGAIIYGFRSHTERGTMTHTQATAPRRAQLVEEIGLQRHYIDGEFRDERGRRDVRDARPGDERGPRARPPTGSAADIDAAVARRAARLRRGPVAAAEGRGARGGAAPHRRRCIRAHAEEFIEREVLDIGMPIAQMRGLAARAAQNFDYYAGVITELHGRSFQVGDEFLNYTIHKPVGVAGLIMPWNAPLMLSTWRIAPALAAGNTIVLKPAEWSPLTATLLAEVLEEAGAADGRLQRRPRLRRDRRRAAVGAPRRRPHLLHRRDDDRPTIIAAGAPTLKRSLDRARRQVAGRRVRGRRPRPRRRRRARADLHDERPALHRRLAAARPAPAVRADRRRPSPSARANIRVGDPFDPRTELGPLIRPEHHAPGARTTSSRRARRARASSPAASGPAALPDGNFLEATVIADVDERMRVFQEEIFGPVLVAMPFDDEAEAIRLANATPVRPRRLRVDERHQPRAPRRARDRHRHVLDQLAERPRPAHAVRRRQEQSASAARAATTRSSSTARPRSSTSRSARTPSRGSGWATRRRTGDDRRTSSSSGPRRSVALRHHARGVRRAAGAPTSTRRCTSTRSCSGCAVTLRDGDARTCAAGRSASTTRWCCAGPTPRGRRGSASACAPMRDLDALAD